MGNNKEKLCVCTLSCTRNLFNFLIFKILILFVALSIFFNQQELASLNPRIQLPPASSLRSILFHYTDILPIKIQRITCSSLPNFQSRLIRPSAFSPFSSILPSSFSYILRLPAVLPCHLIPSPSMPCNTQKATTFYFLLLVAFTSCSKHN
jgi:hypothetical protein